MEILISVPGIGKLGAATLLAEIGNFKDFSSGNKLASWLDLVPNVYPKLRIFRRINVS